MALKTSVKRVAIEQSDESQTVRKVKRSAMIVFAACLAAFTVFHIGDDIRQVSSKGFDWTIQKLFTDTTEISKNDG